MPETPLLENSFRENLRGFLRSSPIVKLLCADNAIYIIDFLREVFKIGQRLSIQNADLNALLSDYQFMRQAEQNDALKGTTERYLQLWIENGWLCRYYDASSTDPQVQLTSDSESALLFVERAIQRSTKMIGTQDRLRLIVESLQQIVAGETDDPELRLQHLLKQRTALDQQITALQAGQPTEVFNDWQVRERFQTAIDLLHSLKADFRGLEDRFRKITRDVQMEYIFNQKTRGQIFGAALDAEDALKAHDEGVSFYAFANFLFSPVQQAALRSTIDAVAKMSALTSDREQLSSVRSMIPSLVAEADRVMKTTARLSSTLRRLLDAKSSDQPQPTRQRVA